MMKDGGGEIFKESGSGEGHAATRLQNLGTEVTGSCFFGTKIELASSYLRIWIPALYEHYMDDPCTSM